MPFFLLGETARKLSGMVNTGASVKRRTESTGFVGPFRETTLFKSPCTFPAARSRERRSPWLLSSSRANIADGFAFFQEKIIMDGPWTARHLSCFLDGQIASGQTSLGRISLLLVQAQIFGFCKLYTTVVSQYIRTSLKITQNS